MIVSEVNKVLKDNKMQNKETNFKIIKNKVVDGPRKPKKPSKYDIILKRLDKIDQFIDAQLKFNIETNKKFEYIFDVFKRNNLK